QEQGSFESTFSSSLARFSEFRRDDAIHRRPCPQDGWTDQPHPIGRLGLRALNNYRGPFAPLRECSPASYARGFPAAQLRASQMHSARRCYFVSQIFGVLCFIGDFAEEKLFELLTIWPCHGRGMLDICNDRLVL